MVQHQIHNGEAPLSRERYRAVHPSFYPELGSLLKGMLKTGVIRESASPLAPPIVLVQKKDGYLEHVVSHEGVAADPATVAVVQQWEAPPYTTTSLFFSWVCRVLLLLY